VALHSFMVTFRGLSGLAQDKFVNTWHFDRPGGAPVTDFDNVRDMLRDFYTVPTGPDPIIKNYSNTLNTTVLVTAYDLSQPKPRAPVYSSSFGPVTYGVGTPLPHEVAMCFSFEAERVSGELQSRRRNRVYLGPLRANVQETTARPMATFCNEILNAGKRLHDAAVASATWDWKVFSPTDQEAHDPVHLWVDDAWDSQRRRGLAPLNRYQFTY
jgi:hypothetical protein